VRVRLLVLAGTLVPTLLLAPPASAQATRGSKVDSAFVAAHDAALRRARVWLEPAVPPGDVDLATSAAASDGFRGDAVIHCRFKAEGVAGSTPKFVCELPDGTDIKVKYGRANPEVYTEVLATRLLNALGFPADRMYPVARVRCYGCPIDPFKRLQCFNEGHSKERCFPRIDYERFADFSFPVIERPLDGRRIETSKERGWAWDELSKIDAAAGGASRSEVDALRLLAVFLGHWDNKAKNQRLLCLGQPDSRHDADPGATCDQPVAMVQDLGATFGPPKLNLQKWAATPIWADAGACVVSMRALPYGGSTFGDTRISDDGRQFLANQLRGLSAAQIRALFVGARVARYPHQTAAGRNVDNWVRAFQAKVDAVVNRPACPDAPTQAAPQNDDR
jgi:hypothetical protein